MPFAINAIAYGTCCYFVHYTLTANFALKLKIEDFVLMLRLVLFFLGWKSSYILSKNEPRVLIKLFL